MKSALKAKLEEAISLFIEDTVESTDWPVEGLVHEDIALHMANAAEAVFDATFASSQFTEREVRS